MIVRELETTTKLVAVDSPLDTYFANFLTFTPHPHSFFTIPILCAPLGPLRRPRHSTVLRHGQIRNQNEDGP